MATVLDTFVTKFRFESDRKDVKSVFKNLSDIQHKALKIGGILFGIFSGGRFLGAVAEKADELGKFAATVGISVEHLQELQFAAKRAGVPVNSLQQSLVNLQRVVGQAARGYGIYGQVLSRFGVSIRDSNGNLINTFDLLKQINRVFQKTSTQGQFDLAQNLGINTQTVRLLQLMPKEFDALIKQSDRLGVITKKDTDKAAKFEDALTDLRTSFFRLSVNFGSIVFPVLTKFIDFLTKGIEFSKEHEEAFKGIIGAVGLLSVAFVTLRLRALAAWSAVFAPATAAIAGAGAIGLIIQDLMVGKKGGKSLLGPAGNFLNKATPGPSSAALASSISKSVNVGDINVNVNTSSTNGTILGDQITSSIKNMFKNSVNDYDSEFSL